MKKILLTLSILFFLINSNILSQTGIHFGVKAGYSIATQYGITPANLPYDVSSDARNGFSGGILLYFPITDAFGVQQEFIYTMKGSGQQITMTDPPMSTTTEYKINYFELPIVFRYTFLKFGDVGIYGSTGFGLSLLLNGEYSVDGVIDLGPGGKAPFSEAGNADGLDEFDYSFIYGLGATFNLLNKNCFFEYRQTVGWNTLMMPASGGDFAPLRNQTYTLSLGVYLF